MKIEHVALYVKDLEGTRIFFEKYFCAKPGAAYHNRTSGLKSYFLTFDGGARLEIMTRPEIQNDEKNSLSAGYAHVAFSVGSKAAVDALTEKLKADGYKIAGGPRTTGDGYYESCIVGIEGNMVEITE
ncbi:VOC family protein [uncultured Treponema sp.]|uniref:VOC family protein n=1 Tax=uncultured Treponema sp. TaxID=162155 RepID=UPI0025F1C0F7|nr:VOC family protein [uncultured Treponema sp.]